MITLWLDDVRNPATHGYPGATWAKSYKEAIEVLASAAVEYASLDHDLGEGAMTGYDVIVWMEQHDVWPARGVRVHSMNPPGRQRMEAAVVRHYGRTY